MACVWTDSWPVCAAGLAFGTYANEGRCFWQVLALNPASCARLRRRRPTRPSTPRCSHCQSSCISRPPSPTSQASLMSRSETPMPSWAASHGQSCFCNPWARSRWRSCATTSRPRSQRWGRMVGRCGVALLGLLGLGMLGLLATLNVHMHGMTKVPAHLPVCSAQTIKLMSCGCRVALIAFHLPAMSRLSPPCLDAGAVQHPGGGQGLS